MSPHPPGRPPTTTPFVPQTEIVVRLTEAEVRQRVVRVTAARALLGDTGDLWHAGVPWAYSVRVEPRVCATFFDRDGEDLPVEAFLSCGEVHAGLRWVAGARLRFTGRGDRIEVDGDLDP